MANILPSAPIWIGDRIVNVRCYLLPRRAGDPAGVVGTLTIEDADGALLLDALQGEQGPPGTPSPIIRKNWGHGFTTPAQLYAAENDLGPTDEGRAWYVAGKWYIWTGTGWDVEEASLEGPPGPTPDLSASAEVVAPAASGPYGEIVVERTGTDADPHLHFKVPGIPGPKGDNSTIQGSSDFDQGATPLDGQGIVWDEAKSKATWGDLSPYHPQMWTIPQGAFTGGSYSQPEQIIAQLSIEAQPRAWWADISGHVKWKKGSLSSAGIQIEVRVELDDGTPSLPGSAPIYALGPLDPSTVLLDTVTVTNISAHFSSEGEPMRAVSPLSEVGRIPANQNATVWVIARRVSGNGSYQIDASWSQVVVRGYPVS